MAIRKILYIVAVLIVLLGLSQVVYASWWAKMLPGMADSPSLYLWGLPGLLLGVVLLIAVMERAVGLRLFLTILALVSIASGIFVLVRPDLAREWVHWLALDRSFRTQVFVLATAGVLRVLIGFALLYALFRPASIARVEATPEPPAEPDMEQ